MYNSDGYVLIDLTGVDITKTNQHLTGIYNRVLTVIDINKLALVINAGDLTPMAAVVHKKLNYYVINTPLYIFTINSNDIIMIEEAGEATVDVAIVPALLDGVKIADFTIGAVEGSLYAPEQQSEINDNITTDYTTWSSDKINTELSDKAEAADVYTKAQVDTALSGKADTSDIPTKTSQLLNDSGFITSAQVPTIDDSSVSSSSVWSSYKTSSELATKANSSDVYTKAEVDTALSSKQNSTDNSLETNNKTVVGAINEIVSNKPILLVATEIATLAVNTTTVISYTFTVPTGYTIVSAYDDSYYAGLVATPIRINQGSGSKVVSFNYFATIGQTHTYTARALALPNVDIRS